LTFLGTELRDLTRLDSIITVVDAANYSLDLFNSQAAYSQIAYGDVIILNKADLVDEPTLQELERKIGEIKEDARILRTIRSEVPLPLILSVGLFESDKYFETETEKHDHHDHDHDHSACGHDHHDHDHHDHDHDHTACGHDHHDHDHHDHDHSDHLENDGFTSISFQSEKPFSIKKFQYFLDNQLPSGVFRAKGIMWFEESPKRHIFHLCGKRFTMDDDEWKGTPKNQLVLIGQNLEKETLLTQLQNCVCIPSTSRGKGFGK
jgi:G3E family GTPase